MQARSRSILAGKKSNIEQGRAVCFPVFGVGSNTIQSANCRRCRRPMREVAEITPIGSDPGLVAFVCAYCGAADSAIVYPKNKTSGMDLSQTQVPAELAALLRARRERPRYRRAANQRDEAAVPHSITSSARTRNDSGIVNPSAFAVVRLMTR